MKWLFTLLVFVFFTFFQGQAFTQPPNPATPPLPSNNTLLPIVLVNNSGLSDDQVFITIVGKKPLTLEQVFVQIDTTPLPNPNFSVGTLSIATAPVPPTPPFPPQPMFDYNLAQLRLTPDGQRVIYMPYITSAVIFFSLQAPINFTVNFPNAIVQPNFTNPTDPSYNIIFDTFEFNYSSSAPSLFANATAVNFFAIPLYGYISTPDPNTNANTGLYQGRQTILSQSANIFIANTKPGLERMQWFNLFLKETGDSSNTVLRLLSTGKAMTAPNPANTSQTIMDANYLDNVGTYGYSYLEDIWTGPNSFYKLNDLTMTIPAGTFGTYTGRVNNSPDPNLHNTLTLTSLQFPNVYTVTFEAPTQLSIPPTTPGTFTTTADIFSGETFTVISDNSPGKKDSVQLSKLLQEAMIAGLVPTTNTLSNPYLVSNQGNFYQINPNLSAAGQTTGPWYDLYSKALHSFPLSIYSFAFDEPLWPQVQISSQNFNSVSPGQTPTFLAVTIGPADLTQSQVSTTTLTQSVNEQIVQVAATVTGPPGSPILTGTVTFILDSITSITVPLVNGQATTQFTGLTSGLHVIEANYSGDNTYLPSSAFLTFFIPSPLTPVIPSDSSNNNPFIPLEVLSPPRDLHVSQLKNRFATQTETVNIITWKAPITGNNRPVLYKIYRDRKLNNLIASVGADTFKYKDHRSKTGRSVYFIVSVDAFGNISVPAKVAFQPH